MQIFGTRFQFVLGSLELRFGVSLEHQSENGSCFADDASAHVTGGAEWPNGERAAARGVRS